MNKNSYLLSLLFLFTANGIAQTLPPLTWDIFTVKDPQQAAGFIDVADFNGDGKKEIVLSTLEEQGSMASPWTTKGAIRVFSMGATLSTAFSEQVVLPTSANLPFINYPQVLDVNEDGNMDILVQQGFITTNGGSHQWLEGPTFANRHNFATETTKGNTYYFWHESEQFDLDNDGKRDIITTSTQTQDATNNNNSSINPKKAKIEWYRNLGSGNFEYHVINDSLGGVFLKMHDIDNDGDRDIAVSQFFWNTNRPALVWLENVAAPAAANNWQGNWNYHIIDHTTGLGYYLEFEDINGDGKTDLVFDNHNNLNNSAIVDANGNKIKPGLFWFEIPTNPAASSQWTKHVIYEGFKCTLYDFSNPASQGTPGIFSIGDIDYNGLKDIAVPGDGNDSLYIFRQLANHSFQKEIVDLGKMFGQTKIADVDNDGQLEIVAAKHNFPEIFQILLPPAGFLKIYRPKNVNVALIKPEQSFSFELFPNPAKEFFTLKFQSEKREHLKIIVKDILGRIVKEENIVIQNADNEIVVSTQTLSEGGYFVLLEKESERAVKQIWVNK